MGFNYSICQDVTPHAALLAPVRRLQAAPPLGSATKSSGETPKPRNESTVTTTVHGFHGHGRAGGFQWFMARCNSCFGIITKTDLACYVCGEPVRKASRGWFSLLRFWAKPTALSGKVRECQETRS